MQNIFILASYLYAMDVVLYKKFSFYFTLVCIGFALSHILGLKSAHSLIRLATFPLLIIYYYKIPSNKNKYLLSFLALYATGELLGYLNFNYKLSISLVNTANAIIILSYISIIILIISKLNIKRLIKQFIVQILILSVVGLFLFLELNEMMGLMYFSNPDRVELTEYTIGIIYNLSIVVLLAISLLNYFYHDSKTALKLLIACALLIFSEFVQIARYVALSQKILQEVYILLLAISYFVFFLYLKNLKNTSKPIK